MNQDPEWQFANKIVVSLQKAGYIAYFAGGCVRDQCLGIVPQDYDVATSATPDQVQAIFGRRQTLLVGAAFGVVCVHATVENTRHQVEVATFRTDGSYTDGRRPDSVSFSSPQDDAFRRDFTINGLFFDPVTQQIIDYVDGLADIKTGVIRAIGNPMERFKEDKLRLLRAVRIASRFGFEIEKDTMIAIQSMADELSVVSVERITAELRKLLPTQRRAWAIAQFWETGLLRPILPELNSDWQNSPSNRIRAIALLESLESDDSTLGMAAWLWPSLQQLAENAIPVRGRDRTEIQKVGRLLQERWKLSNEEIQLLEYLWWATPQILIAHKLPWSQLQPILVDSKSSQAMALARAIIRLDRISQEGIERCEQVLELPREKLNPEPLLTGDDLQHLGIAPGPHYSTLLKKLRALQLDGEIMNAADARKWVLAISENK